jgi:hypothetical protein
MEVLRQSCLIPVLLPGLMAEVGLRLINSGPEPQPAFSVELISLDRLLRVVQGQKSYPSLATGESALQSGDPSF